MHLFCNYMHCMEFTGCLYGYCWDIGLAPLVSAQKWPKDTAMSLSKPPVYLHVPSEQAAAKTTVQPLGPSSPDDCLPCFSVDAVEDGADASERASGSHQQLGEWARGGGGAGDPLCMTI